MDNFGLVEGAIYSRRKDIHSRFGGSWYSGIAQAAESGVVLIFTGQEGKKFGYRDEWDAEHQTFSYTGHGQEGDMEYVSGNRAVRDHVIEGKALLLFEKVDRSGLYRYVGEMQCAGTTEVVGPDFANKNRKIIQFQLVRLASVVMPSESEGLGENAEPSELSARQRAYAAVAHRSEVPAQARRNLYRRSQAVADYVLERAAGQCEYCGNHAPFARDDGSPYLEVHHIERLSDGGLDAPDHVAALCPNCHRRAHCGSDRADIKTLLRARVSELEAAADALLAAALTAKVGP